MEKPDFFCLKSVLNLVTTKTSLLLKTQIVPSYFFFVLFKGETEFEGLILIIRVKFHELLIAQETIKHDLN